MQSNGIPLEALVNPVLKKLRFKGQNPVLLLNPPKEFQKTAKAFESTIHSKPKGHYEFILTFAYSLSDAKTTAKTVSRALGEKGVFWMAYPKGTSKKYKADINRDTGHALMEKLGFMGVSLVALDEDWSAMRYKKAGKA